MSGNNQSSLTVFRDIVVVLSLLIILILNSATFLIYTQSVQSENNNILQEGNSSANSENSSLTSESPLDSANSSPNSASDSLFDDIISDEDSIQEEHKSIKNIILLIGDGMGFNHLEYTKKYYELQSLAMESMNCSNCTTYSLDNLVTDSAAAATALATGYKTNNSYVAQLENTVLKSIMQYAKEFGKKTGVITTDDPYGATPTAFSSHSNSRSNHQNLLTRQFSSNIDLIIGGVYEADLCTERVSEITGRGYSYVTNYDSLLAAEEAAKIYGVLPTLHSNYVSPDYTELKDVTSFALDYLSDDKDGFMLMVEGARIDKFSHGNSIEGMANELKDFDETVAVCLEWAKDRDDTVVLVTADHETGGLTLENDEYIFTSTWHTGVQVPLFSYGVTLEEQLYDNTNVFDICLSLVARGKYSD